MYLLGLDLVAMETLVDCATKYGLHHPHLKTHLTERKRKPAESDVQRCYNSD